MSNKKKIVETFDKNFNKKENYNKIIKKVEMKKSSNLLLKYSYIPVCFLLLLIIGLYFNNSEIVLKPKPIVSNNKVYINNIKANEYSLDADLKKIDGKIENTDKWDFDFINSIKVSANLVEKKYYEIYVKGEGQNDYNLLHDYVIEYKNDNSNIVISFSKIGKPLRDYLFSNKLTPSIINNNEVIISKYQNNFIAEFNYNNINFDIETNNITQDELITVLESIIK